MELLEILEALNETHGPSGDEGSVRAKIEELARPFADEVTADTLGNLIVHKKGREAGSKKVLFSAHMDEVGFIITHVTKEGMLHFATVGGVTPAVTAGRPVLIGKDAVPGVIGTRPVHLITDEERKEYAKTEDMRIDIGAKDKEDALGRIALGDQATFIGPWKELGEE